MLFDFIFYKYSAPLELKKDEGPTGRRGFSTVALALLRFPFAPFAPFA
jgi:hypothetical protein